MNPGIAPSKIGFSCRSVVDDPFDYAFELEDMGFSGWEIVCEGNQTLLGDNLEKISNVIETTSLTLTIHLPFSDLNLASLNENIWDETIHQMTEIIGLSAPFSRLAVVHPGHLSPLGMQMPDLAWDRNIQGLQRLCDFADEYDVTIGVENMVNMDFIFGRQAEEMLGMIESVDRDNLGLTFDVGHANTNARVDEFLDKCLDKVVHVHLHDNHGKKDEHLPAGQGTVDWKKVCHALQHLDVRFILESRSIEEGKTSLGYITGD